MSSNLPTETHRTRSLAVRLTIWYAAAALTLVLGATVYLYWGLALNMDREDDQFLRDKVTAVRRVLDQRSGDLSALDQYVQAASTGRFYLRVRPTGSDGPVVESTGMARLLPDGRFPPAAGSNEATEMVVPDGRVFRLLTVATEDRSDRIYVAMDTSHDEELLGSYRRQLAYVLGLTLLAATVGGYAIARRGLRPIANVTATARRIGPRHLGERIATTGLPAEVRDLAETFNPMLARLEDAFARLGRFTADIAHELRTPVNTLRVGAEVSLQRSRTPEEYREVLGSCLEECGRLSRMIDSLLFLARAEDPKTELVTVPMDVADELRTIQEFFEPTAAENKVRLSVEAASGQTVRADRTLFQRAVGNLVANALAHTPTGGSVTLFAAGDPLGVRVGVRDSGPGIPAEHLPYIFDRFYRADAARSTAAGRVGLGLALVKGIAELHGGTVTAVNDTGSGATVSLTLPTVR